MVDAFIRIGYATRDEETPYEARVLDELAEEHKLPTQLFDGLFEALQKQEPDA